MNVFIKNIFLDRISGISIIFGTDRCSTRASLYDFKTILEDVLPKSYAMIKPLYDPLMDEPITIDN